MTITIKSRKQAIADGDKKYFTGKPCAKNHLAYRYTQSGTCEACIRGHVADERESLNFINNREQVAAAKMEMGVFNIRCFMRDIDTLKGTALELAKARFPGVGMSDIAVASNATQSDGGTVLIKLRVHGADIDLLKGVERALLNAGSADGRAEHERIKERLLQQANDEAQQLPEWKP